MSSEFDSPLWNSKVASSQDIQDTSHDSSTASTCDSSRPEVSSSDVDVSPKQEGGERDFSVFTMGEPDVGHQSGGHIETESSTFGDSKAVVSVRSEEGSEKTVPIYYGDHPIPECMTQKSTLSDCTNKGIRYVDETNDFILEIQEGAIPEGERLTVDVGVALFGPFQFPEGLRPVSPVFWVCVRDNRRNFQFSKPVTVAIPHFLDLDNEEEIKCLGLTFLKANHNKNSAGLYEFQSLTEGEMDFNTLRTHGILRTSHFCSLCLAAKFIPSSTQFCITSVIPRCPSPVGKNAGGCLFVTFLNLKTCLQNVDSLINKRYREGYKTQRVPFRFKTDTQDPALEMNFSQPKHGRIGWKGRDRVFRSEVDFFVKDDISEGELQCLQSDEFYPPRFEMFFAFFKENATLDDGQITFSGATIGIKFNLDLDLPDFTSPPVTHPAAETEVVSQIELKLLVIDDLQDVRSKLMEVETKWRDIGLELGLRDPQLETIHQDHHNVTSCFTAMLRHWLNRAYNTSKYGEPTWRRLSEAVCHRAGGNNPALAD